MLCLREQKWTNSAKVNKLFAFAYVEDSSARVGALHERKMQDQETLHVSPQPKFVYEDFLKLGANSSLNHV